MHDTNTVLFHVGLHKTGTTWLQKNFFTPQHKKQIYFSEDRKIIRGNLLLRSPQRFNKGEVFLDYEPLVKGAARLRVPLVLSDEMLAGLPFHHPYTRIIAAQNMKKLFPEAKILVTIREQRKVILSSYGHYVRAGFSASFNDFLAQPTGENAHLFSPILNVDHFDYFQLLLLYEEIFSAKNVMVAPMEWMLADQVGFAERLSTFLGCSLKSFPHATNERVKVAWSHIALKAAAKVNLLSPQDSRWCRRPLINGNSVAWWVDRFTPEPFRKRGEALALEKIELMVGDRFERSNREMSARIGLDLSEYGYAI
jgi:hypothetical protein